MQQASDEHYVRAVTRLGDTRNIITHRDIYSESGIKLVTTGIRITTKLYDRLINHKLLPHLDMCLSIEDAVTAQEILEGIEGLLKANRKLQRMAEMIEKSGSYRQTILGIRLPAPILFKLTVFKENLPHIYQHSLVLAMLAIYLARCDGMELQEEQEIVTAALCHDLGFLHIDPALLESSHVMNAGDRRYLYTHPVTTYMLLREFTEISSNVANAVLEHHERMDGSGYPRGLKGGSIGRYGQILGVAEVVAKAFEPSHAGDQWGRMEMMLKLNTRQFGAGLIGHLDVFHEDIDAESAAPVDIAKLSAQVQLIYRLFSCINEGQHGAPEFAETFEFVKSQLADLKRDLFEAGLNPEDPEGAASWFILDPSCMSEFAPLLDETLWQIKALVLEIMRRWPKAAERRAGADGEAIKDWLPEMMGLLEIHGA